MKEKILIKFEKNTGAMWWAVMSKNHRVSWWYYLNTRSGVVVQLNKVKRMLKSSQNNCCQFLYDAGRKRQRVVGTITSKNE
jgi:hypothetical protein